MKSQIKKIILGICIAFSFCIVNITGNIDVTERVLAHPGRIDGSGGHRDNKNRSGLGYYHYHCGGYPAHLHKNGICPYTGSKNSSSTSSVSRSRKGTTTSSDVKKVQKMLNKKGYSCGTPDGVLGKKTISALKQFQRDKGLTVDGKIGTQVKKSLGIQ